MPTHPSHKTRSSDASTFDEICKLCGQTDVTPATETGIEDPLGKPCPGNPEFSSGTESSKGDHESV